MATTDDNVTEYFLANRDERERLEGVEATWDPATIERLDKLGLTEGWRCLEVGAGAGSIARWLGTRVGPSGHVLATDIDTRFLEGMNIPNVEVQRHDIVNDPLPEEAFDLIHARLLLMHLPERELTLKRMVKALQPGGRLLVEDADCASWAPVPDGSGRDTLFSDVSPKVFTFLGMAGADFFYARRLGALLRTQGLADVEVEGRVSVITGGSRYAQVWERTLVAVQDRITGIGMVTTNKMESFLALLRDPSFEWMGAVMVRAWGRKGG